MRDPRLRLRAWLDGRPFVDELVVCGALVFVIGWPLMAAVENNWSAGGALTFGLVSALPVGALIAYQRRRRSTNDR